MSEERTEANLVDRVTSSGSVHSRRSFLGRAATTGLAVSSLPAFLAACGGDDKGSSTGGGGGGGAKEINLLTWESYQNPEWLAEFTEKTGIKVNQATVGSPPEMFSKYKSNPEQFDIAYVTAGWFGQWVNEDLLHPIDEDRVTAISNVNNEIPWRDASTVDGTLYGVMYSWGDQPMGWNKEAIADVDVSKYVENGKVVDWNIYWDPAFKGKVSMFDDLSFVQPMVCFAIGIEDPYNLDDAQFDQLDDKLQELKQNLNRLVASPNDQLNQFVSGDASVGYIQLPVVITQANEQGVPMEVNHVMRQKMPAWSDNASITKAGAEKLDAVYEFMNYELSTEWQARYMAATGNNGTLTYEEATTPEAVEAGLTKEKLDATLIPLSNELPGFFDKFSMAQTANDLPRRVEIWNNFKVGA